LAALKESVTKNIKLLSRYTGEFTLLFLGL